MKESIYNNRIPYNENYDIVYNTLTHSSLLVKKNIPFSDLYSNKIETIKKLGFLVDEDVDEFEIVSRLFYQQIKDNKNYFRLTINPTLNCNFNCWYCYENHRGSLGMNKESFEKTRRLISTITDNYNFISIMFFGGEPLLEYENIVVPIMRHCKNESLIKNKKYSISFTTNGFLVTDEMINFFKDFNIGSFQITLDGGRESHNNTRISNLQDSFITIVSNIKKLAREQLNILVRINVTKKNIKSALEIPDYFNDLSQNEKKYIKFTIQQVWQDKSNDISEDTFALCKSLTKTGFKISPSFKSRLETPCYGDCLPTAVINYNGNIYKCTAIDFDKFKPDGEIKNDGTIELNHYQQKNREQLWTIACKKCRIFPLCCGGCAKTLMCRDNNVMFIHPTDKDKNDYIMHMLEEQFSTSQLKI